MKFLDLLLVNHQQPQENYQVSREARKEMNSLSSRPRLNPPEHFKHQTDTHTTNELCYSFTETGSQ